MAFKLRSGNKPQFKQVGSSQVDLHKKPVGPRAEVKPEETLAKPMTNEEMDKAHDISAHVTEGSIETQALRRKENKKQVSPAKQKLNKGGEGQDQNKEFNNKGEHIGDWVNDKLVMKPGFKRPVVKKDTPVKPKEGDMKKYSDLEKYDDDRPVSPAKQAKTKGLGPRTALGGVKNPELVKTKKTKSKKVMIDGPKKQVTGVKNPGNWQPNPNTFQSVKKKESKMKKVFDHEGAHGITTKLLKTGFAPTIPGGGSAFYPKGKKK